jgi:O-antigen ligase
MFLGSLHLLAILISSAVLGPASPEKIIDYQPFVTLLVPNDVLIAGLCLPASVVVLRQMNKQWKPAPLLMITAYFASAVYASYLLQSKVGMISLLAALVAMAVGWKGFAQAGQRPGRFAPWGIALAAVLFLLASGAFYLGNQSTTRLGLWSYAVSQHTAAEVLVGTGPNTFNYDPTVVETPFEEEGRMIPWAHNLFLESYTEQGLFGLVGILAISVIPVMRAIRIEHPALRGFLFASALTFFLLGLLEITLTRRFYFAYLALIYGLSCSPALRR